MGEAGTSVFFHVTTQPAGRPNFRILSIPVDAAECDPEHGVICFNVSCIFAFLHPECVRGWVHNWDLSEVKNARYLPSSNDDRPG